MSIKSNHSFAQDELLKAPQVAKILNISKALAYRLMQQNKIRTVHIEGSRRVRFSDLQEYIEKNLSPETR